MESKQATEGCTELYSNIHFHSNTIKSNHRCIFKFKYNLKIQRKGLTVAAVPLFWLRLAFCGKALTACQKPSNVKHLINCVAIAITYNWGVCTPIRNTRRNSGGWRSIEVSCFLSVSLSLGLLINELHTVMLYNARRVQKVSVLWRSCQTFTRQISGPVSDIKQTNICVKQMSPSDKIFF